MKKQWIPIMVALIVVGGLLWGIAWRQSQPIQYFLLIKNLSDKPISQFQLFGPGVLTAAQVTNVLMGDEVTVSVTLQSQGEMRFEVVQGLNKIDTLLVEDVGQLERYSNRLEVYKNNRFIFEW
jgi:hypothetical protein